MTVNVGDVLRASARSNFGTGGFDLVNVFHFQFDSAAAIPDAQAVTDIGAILEDMENAVISRIGTIIKYVDITIQNITQNTLLGANPWPTITAGLEPGDVVSPQVAALIIGRTLTPGIQARKYHYGAGENQVNNGTFLSTMLTSLGNYAARYIADNFIVGETYTPIAYNKLLDRRTKLTSSLVIATARTQRRRTIGRGS